MLDILNTAIISKIDYPSIGTHAHTDASHIIPGGHVLLSELFTRHLFISQLPVFV